MTNTEAESRFRFSHHQPWLNTPRTMKNRMHTYFLWKDAEETAARKKLNQKKSEKERTQQLIQWNRIERTQGMRKHTKSQLCVAD